MDGNSKGTARWEVRHERCNNGELNGDNVVDWIV